jgi:hypothetical protein
MKIIGRLLSYLIISLTALPPFQIKVFKMKVLTFTSLLTSPSASSRSLACSSIPATEFSNAAVALYPKVMILALGRSFGRRSRSHSFPREVKVWFGEPLRPWRQRMLKGVLFSVRNYGVGEIL